jgi:hypothetical protein
MTAQDEAAEPVGNEAQVRLNSLFGQLADTITEARRGTSR